MSTKPVNDLTVEEEECAAINLMRRWAAVEKANASSFTALFTTPEYQAWKDWSVKRALRTKTSTKEQFAALERIEDATPNFKPRRENTCNMTDKELADHGWSDMIPDVKGPGAVKRAATSVLNGNAFGPVLGSKAFVATEEKIGTLPAIGLFFGVPLALVGLALRAILRR